MMVRMDVVAAYPDIDQVVIYLGDGNGSFVHHSILFTGLNSGPYYVTIHDMNNDTFLDIVVANRDRHNIGIFLGSRDEVFSEQMTFQIGYGSSPFIVVVSDFNQDNLLDLAVGNNGTDSISILLQTC